MNICVDQTRYDVVVERLEVLRKFATLLDIQTRRKTTENNVDGLHQRIRAAVDVSAFDTGEALMHGAFCCIEQQNDQAVRVSPMNLGLESDFLIGSYWV